MCISNTPDHTNTYRLTLYFDIEGVGGAPARRVHWCLVGGLLLEDVGVGILERVGMRLVLAVGLVLLPVALDVPPAPPAVLPVVLAGEALVLGVPPPPPVLPVVLLEAAGEGLVPPAPPVFPVAPGEALALELETCLGDA